MSAKKEEEDFDVVEESPDEMSATQEETSDNSDNADTEISDSEEEIQAKNDKKATKNDKKATKNVKKDSKTTNKKETKKDTLKVPGEDGEEEEGERRLSVGKVVLGLQEGSVEMEERLRLIRQQKLTFRDYMEALDWDMLKLFFVCVFAFLLTGFLLTLVILVIIYFTSEDLWYEYFPVPENIHDEL